MICSVYVIFDHAFVHFEQFSSLIGSGAITFLMVAVVAFVLHVRGTALANNSLIYPPLSQVWKITCFFSLSLSPPSMLICFPNRAEMQGRVIGRKNFVKLRNYENIIC